MPPVAAEGPPMAERSHGRVRRARFSCAGRADENPMHSLSRRWRMRWGMRLRTLSPWYFCAIWFEG
eukprot:974522-Pyramimonas_sp.AAC.1